MVIVISQGTMSMTHHWSPSGWTLRVSCKAPQKFHKLEEAKKAACAAGASGKWRRETRPTGVRGALVTYYVDSQPEHGAA